MPTTNILNPLFSKKYFAFSGNEKVNNYFAQTHRLSLSHYIFSHYKFP